MKRIKIVLLCGLSFYGFAGCAALMGLEERTIIVVDAQHRPIEGASVSNQPLVPGPKNSGKDGRLRVYVMNPARQFEIDAIGYKSGSFSFDQPGNECVLSKKTGKKRQWQ